MPQRRLAPNLGEADAVVRRVAQNERTVAEEIDIDDLNVGLARGDVIGLGDAYRTRR